MKTSELKPGTTAYALKEDSYWAIHPVLVVEARLWTEKTISTSEGSRRALVRAERGERAGTGSSWSSFRKTGVPVLKLGLSVNAFRESANPDSRVIDDPKDLLAQAMKQLSLLELVDSGESVFAQSEGGGSIRKTSTRVEVRMADGSTDTVGITLELVRPQAILSEWSEHLAKVEKEALRKAELDAQIAKAKSEKDQIAWGIRDRVTALLDDADKQRYNPLDERYDVHRAGNQRGSSTYEVSESTLLKLLELAEKGAQHK